MAPRGRSGRAAAESAYANLLKEHTALVGDVGAAFEAFTSKLAAAAAAREEYEHARATAVKAGAISAEQLDHLGYRKSPRLPVPKDTESAKGPGTPAPATAGPATTDQEQ